MEGSTRQEIYSGNLEGAVGGAKSIAEVAHAVLNYTEPIRLVGGNRESGMTGFTVVSFGGIDDRHTALLAIGKSGELHIVDLFADNKRGKGKGVLAKPRKGEATTFDFQTGGQTQASITYGVDGRYSILGVGATHPVEIRKFPSSAVQKTAMILSKIEKNKPTKRKKPNRQKRIFYFV